MAALNKCNPAQLLILHIIKFLIYTLCFRGPTHNSLVLNSRGIKTNAPREPRHPSPAWVNSCCRGGREKDERGVQGRLWGARGAEARARASLGARPRARSSACSTTSEKVPGRLHPSTRTHPRTLTHPDGLTRLTQASLADIFLGRISSEL